MDQAAALAKRRGFITVEVDYPLCNIAAAAETAFAEADKLQRHGYRVFAYGDSAGGTLAALLAERGLAQSAVAAAPASDLLHWPDYSDEEYRHWFRVTRAQRYRLSPAFHRSKRRILVLQGNDGFKSWNRAWAKRDPLVRYQSVPGDHPDRTSPEYRANTILGMDWLRDQVTAR
jgi:acetyl esterase/lipase